MRPDPQARATVLMLAGVLILLALSLVAGDIVQKAISLPPPTRTARGTATPPPIRAAGATATPPPSTVPPRPVAPPTVTTLPAAPSATRPPVAPSATLTAPLRSTSSATPAPAEPSATVTASPIPSPSATPPPVEPSATAVPPPPTTALPPPSPSPAAGGIPHPTGTREIVIQMTEEAGRLPRLDALAARFPTFTLFGDGTLVYHTRTGSHYYQTRLDEGSIQELLTLAITDLHFFDLEPFYPLPNVYDAATTRVRLVAAGQDHQSGALALGLVPDDQRAGPEAPRARLLRLVAALQARMIPNGPPYVPAAVTLYAEGGSPLVPADAAPDWPLPGTALAAVLEASNRGSGQALRLTGPDAVAALAAAATPHPFREAGRRYTVVAVPDGP